MNDKQRGSSDLPVTIAIAALTLMVLAGIVRSGWNQDNARLESPSELVLTVVDDENVPQVCILDIATETIRGDTLRVVVRKAKCPALQ